jgi:hypothetical protein
VYIIDPRGVGSLRASRTVKGHEYADPLSGVEENIAYNAFLVGKCLAGMRTADVLAAIERVTNMNRPQHIVLCGCRDAVFRVFCWSEELGQSWRAIFFSAWQCRSRRSSAFASVRASGSDVLPGALSSLYVVLPSRCFS